VITSNMAALGEYGISLLRTGHPAEAVPVFKRIVRIEPGRRRSLYALGFAEFKAGEYRDAIKTLSTLAQTQNPDSNCLNLLAEAYEANLQTPQAVAALRRAIQVTPRDLDNYLDLATICLDHKSFRVGIAVVNAGIAVLPGSAALYTARGVLYVQFERFDKANADFERARELPPSQNFSSVGLGISLLQSN
jgi:Flp pilus assembly protein TadD